MAAEANRTAIGWYRRGLIPIQAFAGRAIFQVAFVVVDFQEALERYTTALNPGRWRCYTFGADGHVACEYRGGPTRFSSKLALNDQHPQLELIEPLAGPSAHKDWLEERGEGPHHVGIIVESVDATIAEMAEAGYQLVQRGSGIGPEGDGAYAYFDTADALGLLVEAVEPPTSLGPPEFVWPQTS